MSNYSDHKRRFTDDLTDLLGSFFTEQDSKLAQTSLQQLNEAFSREMINFKLQVEELEAKRQPNAGHAPSFFSDYVRLIPGRDVSESVLLKKKSETQKEQDDRELREDVVVGVVTPLVAAAVATGANAQLLGDLWMHLQANFVLHFGSVIGATACSAVSLLIGTYVLGQSFYHSMEVMEKLNLSDAKALLELFKDHFDPYAESFIAATEDFLQHTQSYDPQQPPRKEWKEEFVEKRDEVIRRILLLKSSLKRVRNTLEKYCELVAKEKSIWKCAFSCGFGFVQVGIGIASLVFVGSLPVGLLSLASGSLWIASSWKDYQTQQYVKKVSEVVPRLQDHLDKMTRLSEQIYTGVETFSPRENQAAPLATIVEALSKFKAELALWRTSLEELRCKLEEPKKSFDCVLC